MLPILFGITFMAYASSQDSCPPEGYWIEGPIHCNDTCGNCGYWVQNRTCDESRGCPCNGPTQNVVGPRCNPQVCKFPRKVCCYGDRTAVNNVGDGYFSTTNGSWLCVSDTPSTSSTTTTTTTTTTSTTTTTGTTTTTTPCLSYNPTIGMIVRDDVYNSGLFKFGGFYATALNPLTSCATPSACVPAIIGTSQYYWNKGSCPIPMSCISAYDNMFYGCTYLNQVAYNITCDNAASCGCPNFAILDESGTCYENHRTTGPWYASFMPFCDTTACHMYMLPEGEFVGENGVTLGNLATIWGNNGGSAQGPGCGKAYLGPGSPFIKAGKVGCGGCANIRC